MAAQLRSAPFVVLSLALSLVSMPASRVTAQQIPGSPIVTPDGQTLTALRNATGRVATFTIQSQGDVNETFGLQCSYQGTVGSCSVPSSISVGARQFVDVNVTFTVGGVGTGRVELSATGGGGEDSGWYNVNVQTAVSSGITTGTFHTCGLGGTGEAYCW
ncbi:MAG: hypothetical protein M3466_01890, partial [Gemmatimonadota bacterium]|nr:hypothetical protein [Gemmatimonadota bacterium]